jgi:hypothetical protein
MKKYISHKEVMAGKIVDWSVHRDGRLASVVLDDGSEKEITDEIRPRFKLLTHPSSGYYIQYADGYISWSPTQVFEEGYHPAEEGATPAPPAKSAPKQPVGRK